MQFSKDLLILFFPSVPGSLLHISLSGVIKYGSTNVSPYIALNDLTISLSCSRIGSWSSPPGTSSASNAVISAAWLIGYVKNPTGTLCSNPLSFISVFIVGFLCNLDNVTRFI